MKLYNTLSNKVEEFIPYEEGKIRMYTCGPTVYHYQHIGNLRTYITEDIFEKTFKYLGYNVQRVMNITDVGHLKSDGDTGLDKMVIAMEREHKTSHEVAKFYTESFKKDCDLVNVKWPETVVPATSEIDMYIKIIQKLLDNGFAYISNGNVYFDTEKDKTYYELSGRCKEDLIVASRDEVEEDDNKKNPADFVLWFTNSKFGNQELQWDSPFGRGFPGWHIECSGIAIKYLGEHLDIHFGAEDAVFPHHTNEIAQSEAYLGHKWCNYWVHLSWLLTNNVKMSKSKGDTLTVSKLKEMGYNPLAYRYLILNSYYHKQVNFTFDGLDQAQNAYLKLINKVSNIKEEGLFSDDDFNKYDEKFKEFLSNDLNTSNALTLLYDLIKDTNVSSNTKLKLIKSWDSVLSLDLIKEKNIDEELLNKINELIEKRNIAKENRDYALADQIRDELKNMNVVIKDTKEGTTFEIL
ncbi:cysteine--tRNA ligase [Clostridium sp. CAG:1193]|nr:cysteine--tRNA ligase [Clostridium sp. CAG:1193]